jgi:hypothetical protein
VVEFLQGAVEFLQGAVASSSGITPDFRESPLIPLIFTQNRNFNPINTNPINNYA